MSARQGTGTTGPHRDGDVLNWASELDPNALEQARRTASLPFVDGHVALMPDAHLGLGATVGSVIPTREAVIPSAVGVDIGCGMIAVECPFTSDLLPDDLTGLHSAISKVVPAGVGRGHDRAQGAAATLLADPRAEQLTDQQQRTAAKQLGSLGSGNHFVEVCLDERDRVWVVLHSGSRGIGNQLAKRHIESAKGLMAEYLVDLPDPDLAYLVEGSPEFDEYIAAMLWAQDYAMANREVMVDAVLMQLAGAVGHHFNESRRINCHHNFTEREHHAGRELWITRKGAIRARSGELGVIPGSMGARSYVVEGRGNPASYESCAHGAGRRLSRRQARRQLDVQGLRASMRGRAWNESEAERLIDEDPRSYKDIHQVMEDQRDLVRVRHTLRQVLNYKGT